MLKSKNIKFLITYKIVNDKKCNKSYVKADTNASNISSNINIHVGWNFGCWMKPDILIHMLSSNLFRV